MQTKLKKV